MLIRSTFKCSRSLREVVACSIVWKHAGQSFYAAKPHLNSGLAVPISKQSIDTLRPHVIKSCRLEKNWGTDGRTKFTDPRHIETLSPRPPLEIERGPYILLPGGRWLIQAHKKSVSYYDLELPDRRAQTLISEVELDVPRDHEIATTRYQGFNSLSITGINLLLHCDDKGGWPWST